MKTFKSRLTTSTAWLAFAWTGLFGAPLVANAQAQTDLGQAAQSADVGEVVVTAHKAVDTPQYEIKRLSPGIVDSITATDIAKTDDTNLAEALDRVPGVSSDRFYGTSDAGYVTIRGFDSRYNSMDIDGNPIWFSSQNNRGAQIGMFPSTIVNETSVYKTVTPDQDGNSIGGHISLRTLRAFDGGDAPYFAFGVLGGAYAQNSAINPGPSGQLYGVGKTTFGPDNLFGIVFGASLQQSLYYDKYGGVDTYDQVNGQDLANANIYNNSTYDVKDRTAAIYGKLEARHDNKLYSFVSFNYFYDQRLQYLDRAATYVYESKTTGFDDGAANFTGGVGETKEYDYNIGRNAKVLGTGVDYQVNNTGSLTFRANYTDFSNPVVTRYPGPFELSNVAGSYNLTGDLPSVTPSNPTTYDNTNNWLYQDSTASYIRDQYLTDKVYALRASYDQNTFAGARGLGLSMGIDWTRLDRNFVQTQANYTLAKGTVLSLTPFVNGATMANNNAVDMSWNSLWPYIQSNGILSTSNDLPDDYHLIEDVAAGYLSFYYSGPNYRLLAGARYEATQDNDTTYNTVKGQTVLVNPKHGYGNLLPNVQFSYDVTSNFIVRTAFTKTLARPDFSDFAPGQTTSLDANGNPVVAGTNPNLDPRVSTNYDMSFEYYLRDGVASLALFHKDMIHEEFTEDTQIFNSSGMAIQTDEYPLNDGSAHLNGLEASFYKRKFDFLPAPFNGFGLNSNLTLLDGVWDVVFSNGAKRSVGGLRNQPKILGNLGVSYTIGPVDLNVDWRARGRTFSGTFGTTEAGDIWYASYNQVDLKANWRVTPRLLATFEARNLTNAYYRETTGDTGATYNSVGVGPSYFGGVRYAFGGPQR
jgi:TonB-dependent receptor